MQAEPRRENVEPTRCRCLLDSDGWCRDPTPGPDAPFCHQCEDRHPDLPRSRVGVVPL